MMPVVVSYTGPGDIVSGAVAWWGSRGYNAAYSGKAVTLCTPSDAACEDESISAGNLVLGATGSTCNNSTAICTVKTMYDQSGALACAGAPCDVTQATIASRPTFLLSALNAKGCATSGNILGLISANNLAQSQPLTLVSVSSRTGAQSGYMIVNGTFGIGLLYASGANTAEITAGTALTATASDNTFHANQGVLNGASSSLTVDGSTTSGPAGSTAFSNVIALDNGVAEKFCENGIWPSAFNSTQISSMNSNQHTYWNF